MILPKGEIVYENLRTVYVNLNSFLQTLKEDNFTGYLHVSFWDYEGVLFLEAGEIVNAIEEAQGKRSVGEEAVESIILMSKQKDGRINVYKLVPEMVTIDASDYEPKGPFGAKEVGECARGAVIAAIASAVYDAVGIKISSLPLHPEKILKALTEKETT